MLVYACAWVCDPPLQALLLYLVALRRELKGSTGVAVVADKSNVGQRGRQLAAVVDTQTGKRGWIPPQARGKKTVKHHFVVLAAPRATLF